MKYYLLLIVIVWLIRMAYRTMGYFYVYRSEDTRILSFSKVWNSCYVGRYGKCLEFIDEDKKKFRDKNGDARYAYRIRRFKPVEEV